MCRVVLCRPERWLGHPAQGAPSRQSSQQALRGADGLENAPGTPPGTTPLWQEAVPEGWRPTL